MIKISQDHKTQIAGILSDYRNKSFEKILSEMEPILKSYHTIEPKILGKRLLDSLFKSWLQKENEAIVHYYTISKLIEDYHYPTEQLDHEVSCGGLGREAIKGDAKADIVVYSHPSRRPGTSMVAIECREQGGIDGSKQAASYARALQAKYHVFTDSDKWNAFETQPHPLDGVSISDIPIWVGDKPLSKRLSKKHLLPPLTDEKQLRDLIDICHNQIHGEGLDPAKAFDELVKLFFVKIYDEQELPNEYQFSVLSGESVDETGNHIRNLLKKAKEGSKYRELFKEPGDEQFSISNQSIRTVVETFQGFSFVSGSVIGIDAKGTVYENMVGSTFRGELGQYFTPRKEVEFMVNLLQPNRDDLVLDPACGSGGFLISVLKKVSSQIRIEQQNLPSYKIEGLIKEFADERIKGTDLSPRMVRAARMNMIMHGDGWAGIHRQHGLKIQKLGYEYNTFSLILSNPPFAGFETDLNILSDFEIAKNESGNVRGVNRALPFVEQIIKLLKEGGRAGIVLPRSILYNDSYSFKKIREIILKTCEIMAIIGLPKTAFHHTDTGILGDLLFLKKCSKPRDDYNVFVAWAENVGYNTLGHNIDDNDFPELLSEYNDNNSQYWMPLKRLKDNDNWNPWYYHPKEKNIRKKVAQEKDRLIPLSELVSIYENRISRKALRQTPDRKLNYLEVSDFDPLTGEYSPKERRAKELPSRATYDLNGEELILLPNAKNSLESKRKIIKIGQESNGMILTNRFLPLRPKVNPSFLLLILNTSFVRNQILQKCTGAGSPDLNSSKLNEVMILVPDPNDLSSIDSFMENIEDSLAKKRKLKQELENIDQEIERELKKLES
ncbi:N-6 DNA Methylase [anaerobic digester metagenome]